MRPVNELRGMRYPDDYLIRMFFKERLDCQPGRVLELGCGTGNNLLLFRSFGWSVTGVDISAKSLADARHNFGGDPADLIEADLATGLPALDGTFDCVLLPSVNYYIPRESFVRLLMALRPVTRRGALLYVRSRLPDDWRFGRGREVEPGGYVLDCTETGEFGLLNVFYGVDELKTLIATHGSRVDTMQCLYIRHENPQGGVVIPNSDVVIWGRWTGERGA